MNRVSLLLTVGVVGVAFIVGGLVVMNIVEKVREFASQTKLGEWS
jgi:hypothetical protein